MKKMDKMKKFLLVTMGAFIAFFATIGASIGIVRACAEDDAQATESVEIYDEIVEDEEVVEEEENAENNAEIDDILNAVEEYLDSKKGEDGKVDFGSILADAKTWVASAIAFIISTFGASIVAAVLNRINKNKDILTEAQIEKIANAAADMATKKIVGKSIDVDISAEVSKAVKQELYALANGVSELVDSVKNTEVLTANVAIAQSRSRLLTDAEKKSLQKLAKTAQDHAGKKVVSAPKIEVTAKEENKVAEEVAQKNMQYFNFDGVEKK